jgi:hypothetical protein
VSGPPGAPSAQPADGRDGGSPQPDARPPLGGWGRLYALVLAALGADLLLLWWFTEHYR